VAHRSFSTIRQATQWSCSNLDAETRNGAAKSHVQACFGAPWPFQMPPNNLMQRTRYG
jgi:hypothetical protein